MFQLFPLIHWQSLFFPVPFSPFNSSLPDEAVWMQPVCMTPLKHCSFVHRFASKTTSRWRRRGWSCWPASLAPWRRSKPSWPTLPKPSVQPSAPPVSHHSEAVPSPSSAQIAKNKYWWSKLWKNTQEELAKPITHHKTLIVKTVWHLFLKKLKWNQVLLTIYILLPSILYYLICIANVKSNKNVNLQQFVIFPLNCIFFLVLSFSVFIVCQVWQQSLLWELLFAIFEQLCWFGGIFVMLNT